MYILNKSHFYNIAAIIVAIGTSACALKPDELPDVSIIGAVNLYDEGNTKLIGSDMTVWLVTPGISAGANYTDDVGNFHLGVFSLGFIM